MGPCHTEKTTRQVDGGKPFHSKGSLEYVMANSSPAPHQIKPKLLFNLLVNDNEEYQRPKSGYLKPFDADAHGSFRQSSECISFNPATCKEPTSFKPEALNQHFRKDLDHMAKVEMTRNKLKILLTEPYDKGTDCLSRSFSEPITPPPVRNMLELGKRTNSEGSQYRSLILKKRQKDMILSPTSKESPLLPEDQLKKKRMKNGLNHVEQSNSSFSGRIPSQFENMSKKHETSLLKKLLSRVADDDSEPEYPSISGGICCPMRRLADNRRSLSNSDIYSTSTLTSFLTPYLSMSQPIRRVNYAVKLANSTNDLLFSYLCNSVQYALRLPGFDLLPVDDKRSMIIKAAPRLILLSMAKENYHLEVCISEEPDKENNGEESSKPTIDFVESLKLFIKRFQQHQITDKEFSYLKHIALYQYNDPNKPLAASEQVKKKLLEVFDGLRDLTSEDKTRHSQLLLQLHSLFQLDLKTLETLFFQPLLQSVESLKKLKHLYSDGAWMPADGKNQERSMIVSL